MSSFDRESTPDRGTISANFYEFAFPMGHLELV